MRVEYGNIGSVCHMQAARSKARRLTALYEAAFAPLDLTGGQFTTLVAVAYAERAKVMVLAERIGLDRTTMSRALRPLERRQLVKLETDPEDHRSKRVFITQAGIDLLDRAIPLWQEVQDSIAE